jgi:hypothetical protein
MNRLAKTLKCFATDLSPSCREASRLQSEALDRPLSLRQRIGLRIHVALCRWCRRYGRQIKFLRTVGHASDEHESVVSHNLSEESKERIKRSIKQGGSK